MMKIEAVLTCYKYDDFLSHTLPETLQHVDRLVVVTYPSDVKTKQLCTRYSVSCVETEIFHEEGDALNKGRAINLGLSHLKHDGWLLHLDADIMLPHRFRDMLRRSKLNQAYLYGADRLNVESFEQWQKHKGATTPQFQWRYLVNAHPEFELGSRLLHDDYGYCPIGFFQLWHSSLSRKYPIASGSAEHSDVLFAVQWARENRVLLPEFFVYHLASEPAQMGANWRGRKTKPFGPTQLTNNEGHGKYTK